MKRRTKRLLQGTTRYTAVILLLAVLIASCAAVLDAPNTLSSTDPARALYHRKCGSCHAPFPPHSYSDMEWPGAVDDMAHEAGLTASERVRILDWLMENN